MSASPRSIESADDRFLRQLRRCEPCTVQQLCAALEVTATAVRQKISRFQSAGYIERETIRGERGRPYHVYRLTVAGVRQLGDDYGELARILWKELRGIEDAEIRDRLLGRIRTSLVERYRIDRSAAAASTPGSETLVDRFEQLRTVLAREGFEVEVDLPADGDDALPVLREHVCPYHELAAADRSLCDLEQSVFGEILGVPLTLSRCCQDGDSYCEFEPHLETAS
jgi:predicted ArsR family transcriptional regulator